MSPQQSGGSRVVLITGVSRYLGGRLASLLAADPTVERVIGVDVVPPRQDVGRTEFVRADIRNPIIAKVIASAHVDTVVHMSVIATPFGAGGRTAMKEINVIGTMQLLAACQKAPSLRKLVVKSTTAVYGSFTRYFALPVVPTVFGFDPRTQFVHEDDGIEVLRRAVVENHRGTFNVAGDGVLLLSQAIRRAGRVAVQVPSPAVSLVGTVFRRAGLVDFSPEQMQFLEFGRGVDTTRLRQDFGYAPRFSTLEAFDDFVSGRALTRYVHPERVARVERLVLSGVARRRPANA